MFQMGTERGVYRSSLNKWIVCPKTLGRRTKPDDWETLSLDAFWPVCLQLRRLEIWEEMEWWSSCHWWGLSKLHSNRVRTHDRSLAPRHPALGITELSRAGEELWRNHWSVICMKLFIVPLHKTYLKKKKETQWVQQTWGNTPLSTVLFIAQPLPVTRCGRMSLLRARLSSLRERSYCCSAEQAGERREGNRTPRNICPFCTVCCNNLKNTSNLFHI